MRPLVTGSMSLLHGSIVAFGMTFGGVLYLGLTTNWLTAGLAALTSVTYLAVYTPMKRVHPICTFLGAFPGAMPPVLGWTAVRGRVDMEALVLFGILFFWQFPHFHSIAWLYREDYENARIRMLPVVESDGRSTAFAIVMYALALLPVIAGAHADGHGRLDLLRRRAGARPGLSVVQSAHVDHEARSGCHRFQNARPPVVAGIRHLPAAGFCPDDDQPRGVNLSVASDLPKSGVLAVAEGRSAAAPAVIQLQDLRHQYGDRVALDGVSFDVRPAEIFGLLGPNGCGKTTTFRILSTLMIPSGGRALIMGHDVAREPALVRRNIGVVFQAASIDVKLTALENLMLIGHVYGLRGATLKQRVNEMLCTRGAGRSRQGEGRNIFRRHAAPAGAG